LLFKHHYRYCEEFKRISNQLFHKPGKKSNLEDLPFLHVNLFKKFDLKTNYDNSNHKIYTSSGTTNKNLSKISLDKKTSLLQSVILKNIFSELIGNREATILFVENEKILTSEKRFSARGAAINGFIQLVNQYYFILDKKGKLKIEFLKKILKKKKNIIFFGFTSDVWIFLLKELNKKNIKLRKSNALLVHGGGWKRLENKNISKNYFNSFAKKTLGIKRSINYYGMIEQTGSVFLECSEGYFHSSIYSEIFIRDQNLKVLPNFKTGLIQTMSLIPLSYPGHNILTEDQGYIVGTDNCKCGKLGKYFILTNRVKDTEMRGCSDV
jgi:phenylacetate-coenzyme A ligase PaaK-like adenylate-forming protein